MLLVGLQEGYCWWDALGISAEVRARRKENTGV